MEKKAIKKQKAFLIDGTKCIGCRACQVACKQWKNLPAENTQFFGGPGYQNPKNLSASTYTLIRYHEVVKDGKLALMTYKKDQCQHCLEPACASACIVGALKKTDDGPVTWDDDKCIGCRYCMLACPYDIPKFQWSKVVPNICKCDFCADRLGKNLEPACSKVCPTKAILFGNDRDELIKTAEQRLQKNPKKYHQHIYGKDEVGGTCVLNISNVPLEELGYPKKLPKEPLESFTAPAMHAIPLVVAGLGLSLGVIAYITNRKNDVNSEKQGPH